MPVAIPTWRNVLLMPDAIPARRGSTTLTDVEASGALTSPIPMPPTMKPASSVVQVEPRVIPCMSSSATPITASPPPSRILTGIRVDSRPAIGATTNETQGERQEDHAGLDRRVAEHVLEVERQEEELREHPRRDREGRDLRAGERRYAEEPDVEHRGPRAQLDRHEGDEEHRRGGEEADDATARPAPVGAAEEPEDEREQRRRSGHQAGQVEASVLLVPRLAQHAHAGRDARDPDRDVDEEDPAPADVRRQRAADERPDRHRRARPSRPRSRRPCRARGRGTPAR